jgi:hypothetical protein
MAYALTWSILVALLALWSLAAWALHASAAWAVSNAGAFSGAATGIGSLTLPAWLAAWVPPDLMQAVAALAGALVPAIEQLLQAAPSLAGMLTVAAWGLWGFGALLLLLLGGGLHLLIALGRRQIQTHLANHGGTPVTG